MDESKERQAWVDEASKGDPLAVAKLLIKCHATLRTRAEARMNPALRAKLDPEDVLQEVYIDVFRQLERFEGRTPDSFLNWVLTILDSKIVDAARALHRQKRDMSREMQPPPAYRSKSYWNLLDQLYADSATPSRAARREEAVGALLACASRLSDSHRQVIQLRFLEGRSVSEVARRLGKSPAVIVARTRSALKALREDMDRLGEFTRGS